MEPDLHHKLYPVMSLLFKTKTISSDKNQQSFFANHRRQLGWSLLTLLACLMVVGSAGFGLGFGFQSFTLFSCALGVTFSYLAVTAICLGLMDPHPFKRIILFVIVPTLLFAAFAFAGFWIVMLRQPFFGFDFGGAERWGFDMPFFCMSLAWLFWFYRCYRGWLITKRPTSGKVLTDITYPSTPSVSWVTEILWLFICLGLATLACFLNQALAQGNQVFMLFPVGGLIALLWLLPVTYFVMRTRYPIMAWIGLSIGVPVLTTLIFLLVLYSQLDQPGVVMTDQVLVFFLTLLLACGFPVTFLIALRMDGYRLEVSKPWQEKIKPTQPKPHPLDD